MILLTDVTPANSIKKKERKKKAWGVLRAAGEWDQALNVRLDSTDPLPWATERF